MNQVLVTGAAGFIGAHLSKALLAEGYQVVGIDNLNDYYDVQLKHDRLAWFDGNANFTFIQCNLADKETMEKLFAEYAFEAVVNLAAQAGVRYSIDHPHAYAESNLVGFLNVLEGCRAQNVKHLVYASSSSVYGENKKIPFSVEDRVDNPISLYAATKKSNELMAHAYAHLYGIPTTGLRFFTVYGPWGRPDMAYFKFAKAITAGQAIDVYNYGDMKRDFTYIDDVVEALTRLIKKPPQAKEAAPYQLYNIGNHSPETLMDFIAAIEDALGKKAIKNMLPIQAGDVPSTYADVGPLMADVGFKPSTPMREGVNKFVQWYRSYYGA
ncbi:MAG: capsular biosynthesis protein CpsI [Zetaproteobacteria bacterium CG2_30_46_52]|nr:MAG: capsular biosynthesis protein CpsI [Zetaproteobacteria bacterium CG2_30_46_52]